MSNREPLLSIGMPVYNGEKYIEDALNSILSQSFADYEIVICDNASTDSTQAICRRYQETDSRIRYFRNAKNLGAAFNYNEVFRKARGKYFKWAAADDMIESSFVEKCVTALNEHSDAVLSFTKTTIVGSHGETLSEYDDALDVTNDDAAQRFKSFYNEIRECNAVFGIIRSDVLRRTPLIGNYVNSDTFLLAELSLHGKFLCIPERFFYRRDHVESSSHDKSDQAQVAFFDPAKSKAQINSRWKGMLANFRAVARAPLTVANKAKLVIFCLKLMYWSRKQLWQDLLAMLRPGP